MPLEQKIPGVGAVVMSAKFSCLELLQWARAQGEMDATGAENRRQHALKLGKQSTHPGARRNRMGLPKLVRIMSPVIFFLTQSPLAYSGTGGAISPLQVIAVFLKEELKG